MKVLTVVLCVAVVAAFSVIIAERMLYHDECINKTVATLEDVGVKEYHVGGKASKWVESEYYVYKATDGTRFATREVLQDGQVYCVETVRVPNQ